jgi:hypothetical protein
MAAGAIPRHPTNQSSPVKTFAVGGYVFQVLFLSILNTLIHLEGKNLFLIYIFLSHVDLQINKVMHIYRSEANSKIFLCTLRQEKKDNV